MAKKRLEKLTGADARYGWRIGCDGFVSARKAAEMLGKSHSRLCRWLNDTGRWERGHVAYPIRCRRLESPNPNEPFEVCVRSIEEHKRFHVPVEV